MKFYATASSSFSPDQNKKNRIQIPISALVISTAVLLIIGLIITTPLLISAAAQSQSVPSNTNTTGSTTNSTAFTDDFSIAKITIVTN
jgi:hypothetical protein